MLKELKNRKINCSVCIVGEPTSMKAIQAHKGCYEYSTHFTGLAGHGSAPDKGVNAIEYATRFINKLMELREELKKETPKDSVFDTSIYYITNWKNLWWISKKCYRRSVYC